MIMRRFSFALFMSFMILINCTGAECEEPDQSAGTKSLLIGLIPEQNIFKQIERYTPIADYLSAKTGAKVRLKVLTRYGNIVDNFVSLGLDGAFFGSFTYVMAHMKLDVEVLARPEAIDGTSTYHGVIFVRKDSRINSIRQMQGKRFVFVDKATTAGFLFPLVYFKKQGVKDYKTYFTETYFAGTHKDAIYDVLNKKADIGAAKNTVFQEMAQKDKRIRLELKILTRSADVPENALAVRNNLDTSFQKAIQETLLNMHNDPAGQLVLKGFNARKFIVTTEKEYEPVIEFAREINLDMARYDYMND
jgi:phosphonate transport system substrate-binding protein